MNDMDRLGKGKYCDNCGKYISNMKRHIRRNRCKPELQHRRKDGV
jgi:hypothetical protein